MLSYTEAPIPPYCVAYEIDGCLRGYVSIPAAWGTVEQCAQWIADHLPPVRAAGCFAVYPVGDGRCPSYILPPPSVARRARITWTDITTL